MTKPGPSETAATSLTRDVLYAVRYYLGGRRGLLILAGAAIVGGLAFNWTWLAAAGIAPLLIGVLPCVAMCAVGLCMNRMSGRSCSTEATPERKTEPTAEGAPVDMRTATADIRPGRPTDGLASGTVAAPATASELEPLKHKEQANA